MKPDVVSTNLPAAQYLDKAMVAMPAPTGPAKPPSTYLPGVHNAASPVRKPKGLAKPAAAGAVAKSEDGIADSVADVFEKAFPKGEGSRGGKIAYHTKTGKPVYQSAVSKRAPEFSKMADNWTNNAHRSGKGDDHATAAKQHLVAAFYQHHAGDAPYAELHMQHAEHHLAQAKKLGGASKRTMSWIDKNHASTDALVNGAEKSLDDNDLVKGGKKGEGSRGGHILGHTRTGKVVYAPTKAHLKAHKIYEMSHTPFMAHIATPEGEAQLKENRKHETAHHKKHDNFYEGWNSDDHQDAQRLHSEEARADEEREGKRWQTGQLANRGLAEQHLRMADETKVSHIMGMPERARDQKLSILNRSGVGPAPTAGWAKSLNADKENVMGAVADLFKGLDHQVVDDNDQPGFGGPGQVESSRGGGGKEIDDIAVGLKRAMSKSTADQVPISKSEMSLLGYDTATLEADQVYFINKSTLVADGHPAAAEALNARKVELLKSMGLEVPADAPLRTPVAGQQPPTAGGSPILKGFTQPAAGDLLHVWENTGLDAQLAEQIRKSALGPGADEPIG